MPQPTWVLLLTMSIPSWLSATLLLMATSSRIMHHVTKLKSSQTGFLNMTMSSLYSNGLHSHQISIQKSTFGMWWNERFISWMCSRQICSNWVNLSYRYGPKSLRNVSNTLLNLCHEKITGSSEGKRGPTRFLQGVSNKVASECVCVSCVVLEWYLM